MHQYRGPRGAYSGVLLDSGLSAVRVRSGLTQLELAQRVGVSERTVRNHELQASGRTHFYGYLHQKMLAICEAEIGKSDLA